MGSTGQRIPQSWVLDKEVSQTLPGESLLPGRFLDQMGSNRAGGGQEHGVQSRGHFYLSLNAGWIARETPELTSGHLKTPEIKVKSLPLQKSQTYLVDPHSF